MSSICFICPNSWKPKDIEYTAIYHKEKQQILSFQKMKPEHILQKK